MKNTKNDFDFGPELTEDDIFRLCNSLNAYQHPVRTAGYPLSAQYMLRAQEMIVRLWSENQTLRQMLESRSSFDQ